MNVSQDLSILHLILNASAVVQAVMVLLAGVSFMSWYYIFRKWFTVKAARAQIDASKANVIKTEADFNRTNALTAKDYATKASLDAAIAARDSARAQVKANEAAIQSADANIALLHAQREGPTLLDVVLLRTGSVRWRQIESALALTASAGAAAVLGGYVLALHP